MDAIRTRYTIESASAQTALDIFKGTWKSALPKQLGLVTGDTEVFAADPRVLWADATIDGGLRGKSILELGPFEAYDTRLFEELGADRVVAIEGNSINFLKCLVLKEAINMSASFLHGDFTATIRKMTQRFDIVWASGVLYHQTLPLEFLHAISQMSDAVFIWTHIFEDQQLAQPETAPYFEPNRDRLVAVAGASARYRYRSYRRSYAYGDLPIQYEGGNEPFSCWITKDELIEALTAYGFTSIKVHQEGSFDHMPHISLLATR